MNLPLDIHQIVIFGPGGAGKSCITSQFIKQAFHDKYDPTVEDNYSKDVMFEGEEHTLDIADTAGQEEYEQIRKSYYKSAEGFICVYDVTDRESFEETEKFFNEIAGCRNLDAGWALVIVGNKIDLEEEREVSSEDGEEQAQRYNAKYMECSAKDITLVEAIFMQIIRECVDWKVKRRELHQEEERKKEEEANNKGGKKRKGSKNSKKEEDSSNKDKDKDDKDKSRRCIIV